MKYIRKPGSLFADYPSAVTTFVALIVGIHLLLAQKWPLLNVAHALTESTVPDPRDTLMGLSLGVAGVSAMVGGFAGVVVVFGLGTEHDRFRLLRKGGGNRLRASWTSVVLSSFAGAFGAVLSAVIVVGFNMEFGMWVLELCLLLTAHGAVRLSALLAGLARIIDAGDQDGDKQKTAVSSNSLIPKKTA